jgi:hypothetical protein
VAAGAWAERGAIPAQLLNGWFPTFADWHGVGQESIF